MTSSNLIDVVQNPIAHNPIDHPKLKISGLAGWNPKLGS